LSFARAFETQADLLAIQTMSAAGYDPGALVTYIGRMQPEDKGEPQVFTAFPPRAARIAHLEKAIQDLLPKTYSSSDEFLRIQNEVRRLTPRQGQPKS